VAGRRHRCFFWVVCGVLVICLAGIELPELLTLTNDTSNDFTTSLTSSEASAPVQIRVADSHRYDAGAAALCLLRGSYIFPATLDGLARRSARDLLVLHSFWRT